MNTDHLEIIPYEDCYRDAFKTLNVAWLEKFFRIEPLDEVILSDPQTIVREGGHIFFARYNEAIVGTCALLTAGASRFELSKMAVREDCQGYGIGRQLLETAIRQFQRYPGHTLFLETNSILKPAINLYQSVGLRQLARPLEPAHYDRADVYMVYDALAAPSSQG